MIMITYSSNERNNGKLGEIKKELSKMRLDLWMDDPRDDTNDFGIAPGDLHRERIAEAILSADLILVLSSVTWWNSEYCIWEFEFAKRAGKRIVFYPIAYGDEYGELAQKAYDTGYPVIESIDQLGGIIQVGRGLADAHAKILMLWYAYRGNQDGTDLLQNPWVMQENRFWETAVAEKDITKLSKDVAKVNHAAIMIAGRDIYETVGISPNKAIISFAEKIIDCNSRRQRYWRSAGIFILSVIIFLSVMSAFLSNLASKEEKRDKKEQLVQQSILLADRSQEQENSFIKMELANKAWHSADTSNAQNSLRLAEQENMQIQSFRIPQGKYVGATFTQNSDFLVVGEQNNLYIVNHSNGEVDRSIALDFEISARQIAASKDADQIAVVNEYGKLTVVDTQTGAYLELDLDLATAFCVDTKDRLWIAYDDGHVSVSESPWAEGCSVSFQTEAKMPTSILVTDDNKDLVVLLDSGDMQIYTLPKEINIPKDAQDGKSLECEMQEKSLHLESDISMFVNEYKAVPALGTEPSLDADALVQSGDNIAALRKRHISVWEKDENRVECDEQVLPAYGSLIIPASLGGAVVTYHGATNYTRVCPKGSANPLSFMYLSSRAGGNILAGTTEGEMAAIVQPDGVVKIVHIDNVPILTGTPKGYIPVPTDEGIFTMSADGKLYSMDGNVKLDIAAEILLGTDFSADGYFFILSQSGRLFAIDTQTFQIFQSDKLPVLSSSLYHGSNKRQVLAYGEKGYCVYHVDNGKEFVLDWYDTELSVLKKTETIFSAAIDKDGDRIALATSLGRILLISAKDNTLLSEGVYISAGYGESLLFNDDGQLLVLSAGGRVHLYDENLNLVTMTIFNRSAMGFFPIQDSSLALVRFVDGGFALINTQDLLVFREIPIRSNGNMTFFAVDLEQDEFWTNQIEYTQDKENPYTAELYQFKMGL